MMRIPSIIGIAWLVLVCLAAPTPARAAVVNDLYQAEVEVAGRGEAERGAALGVALGRVLLRVSGGALAAPPEAAGAVDRYVQQYRYTGGGTGPDNEPQPLRLWARFDAVAVDALLRDAGAPVWGAVRPLTVVWLAAERDGERQLIGAHDDLGADRPLRERAELRGLPLRLPLLDLTDRSRVDPADVWGGFHRPLLEAAERYQPQAVLVGRLHRQGDAWLGRWNLLQGDDSWRWESRGESYEAAAAAGVDAAADHLASRFARHYVGDALGLRLEISAVGSLADLKRVVAYLASLSGVSDVRVEALEADRARIGLRAEGGVAPVVQTLALGDTLAPVPRAAGEVYADDTLVYRLQQ